MKPMSRSRGFGLLLALAMAGDVYGANDLDRLASAFKPHSYKTSTKTRRGDHSQKHTKRKKRVGASNPASHHYARFKKRQAKRNRAS